MSVSFPPSRAALWALFVLAAPSALAAQPAAPAELAGGDLVYGAFVARFERSGEYSVRGEGWPELRGRFRLAGDEVELAGAGSGPCGEPGRYRWLGAEGKIQFEAIEDSCRPRRMILDRSFWRPAGDPEPTAERRILLETVATQAPLPAAEPATGSWPSFRGPLASGVAHDQGLPDRWDAETGENVRWRQEVPGLGHSSPVVWGDRVFVTSAVSADRDASFRPGLYGDGDASDDRSVQRWEISAFDKRKGRLLWRRVAAEGSPIDRRHIKSTYANSTPATDGRTVVAWFGSQGVFAFDVEGRPRWRVDLGRLDLGAYDVPSYEWGPASSPLIWDGKVFLQCDTQADSFLLALDLESGETIWKTGRDELPGWATPTIGAALTGPELVTNGARFVRGYDPRDGRELWRLGGSSKITAPTPIAGHGLIVVGSGRRPERPIFVLRPGSRGDLTLASGASESEAVVWSSQGRGPYMPTPLILDGLLYVLGNNGVFDAYELATGREIYRQRLPHRGSGFSASPVAADGRLFLSSEDGDVLVVAAGEEFHHLGTNSMNELLMATPAISDRVLYLRSASSLFAIADDP